MQLGATFETRGGPFKLVTPNKPPAALPEEWAALMAVGRAGLPALFVPDARLAPLVAGQPAPAVGDERAAEVYLALSCASGAPEALRLLEARYLGEVARALRQRAAEPEAADEALQRLRLTVLVG